RFLFSRRGRHTMFSRDWSSDVCSSDLGRGGWRQVDVPAKQITRVALRIGPMHGRVRVTARDRNIRLLVPRSDAYKLATALTGVGNITRPSPNLPGPVLMVRRVFDHVLALPAAALNPEAASTPAVSRMAKEPATAP